MNDRRLWTVVVLLFGLLLLGAVTDFGELLERVGVLGIGGLCVTALGLAYLYLRGSENWQQTLQHFLPGNPPPAVAGQPGGETPDPEHPDAGDAPAEPPAVHEDAGRPADAGVDRRDVLIGGVLALLGLGLTVAAPAINDRFRAPGPAFRAAASAAVNGTGVLPLPRPAGVEAGDVLVAQVHGRSRDPFRPPAGWTRVASVSGSGDTMECFWKLVGEQEPTSYPFDGHQPNGKGGGITAWSGVDQTDPIADSQVAEKGETPEVVLPAVTSPSPTTPVIMMVGSIGAVGVAMPGAMDTRWAEVSPPGEFVSTSVCATSVGPAPPGGGDEVARIGIDPGYGGWVGILVALRAA
ncbi:hypothetical protein ACFPK1_09585 [Actinomycetospora rhizophila]|uniref:Uncharacterized protein n=1 Tax=Actinomycetospora rhizophila TaxID=1416876 RepID=A0ABV9ZDV3_9PSEU